MGSPLSPSFTISAADISKMAQGWERDPVQTVDGLKEHARALKVFKKDNPQIRDSAAEDAFRALNEACNRIGKIISDRTMPFRTNLQVVWHYGVWLSHMGCNQEALSFITEAEALCPQSDRKMHEKITSISRKNLQKVPRFLNKQLNWLKRQTH